MVAMADVFESITSGEVRDLKRILKADPDAASERNADGISALMIALYDRKHEHANVLLACVDPDTFEAAALGRTDRVKDVDAWSADGFTPLHLAAFFGQRETVARLLELGADANAVARNKSAVRPLHSAVVRPDLDLVRRLLEAGADVNAKQDGGWTALAAATQHGNDALTALLREFGATSAS